MKTRLQKEKELPIGTLVSFDDGKHYGFICGLLEIPNSSYFYKIYGLGTTLTMTVRAFNFIKIIDKNCLPLFYNKEYLLFYISNLIEVNDFQQEVINEMERNELISFISQSLNSQKIRKKTF